VTRPTVAHPRPCRDCPAAHFEPDPEALDVRAFVDAGLLTPADAVYPCGWAPSKLCRGAAEFYGLHSALDNIGPARSNAPEPCGAPLAAGGTMTPETARLVVDAWNKAVPVGTPVCVARDNGEIHRGRLKHAATLTPNGLPIGWVDGIPGYYLLDRITVDAVTIRDEFRAELEIADGTIASHRTRIAELEEQAAELRRRAMPRAVLVVATDRLPPEILERLRAELVRLPITTATPITNAEDVNTVRLMKVDDVRPGRVEAGGFVQLTPEERAQIEALHPPADVFVFRGADGVLIASARSFDRLTSERAAEPAQVLRS
jgi:hypothetical protein